MSRSTVITEVRSWLTPILVAMIGWLAADKLQDIDSRLQNLEGLQTQQAVTAEKLSALTTSFNQLNGSFQAHVELVGKAEDEITLDKLKHTR